MAVEFVAATTERKTVAKAEKIVARRETLVRELRRAGKPTRGSREAFFDRASCCSSAQAR
jgi:hypothetical protein